MAEAYSLENKKRTKIKITELQGEGQKKCKLQLVKAVANKCNIVTVCHHYLKT